MENLLTKLKNAGALFRPASQEEINQAENELNIIFSDEYKNYLSTLGVISYEANETYGLGIPKETHLSLFTVLTDLRNIENDFPTQLVPLCDIGDGHLYVYDNISGDISIWASPNGGIQKNLGKGLENFLIKLLFN